MKEEIVAAAVQMRVAFEDVEANLVRAGELIERAAERGAELVLLPEEFTIGLPQGGLAREETYRRRLALSEPLDGPTVQWMAGLAREFGLHLCGGVLEREEDRYYNTAVMVDSSGDLAGSFRKVHTMGSNATNGLEDPGDEVGVWDTDLARFGCMTCYDHRFPELARAAALQGAEIILHPTLCGGTTDPLYDKNITIRSRAVENRCFVVVANAAQPNGVVGNTQIIAGMYSNPERNDFVLGIAQHWEDVVVATLESERYRGPQPDRRPESYSPPAAPSG
jgi:predicted amidohydrolase